MQSGNAIGGLLIYLLTLTGCPNKSSTEASENRFAKGSDQATPIGVTPADRSVLIISISPDPDKPLRAGSTVKLAIAVEYAIPSPGGIVGW